MITLITTTVIKAQARATMVSRIAFFTKTLPIIENEPMLYVDVNLGNSGTQRIVVYDGDTAEGLALKFATEYQLDDVMKEKLTQMLQ